MAACLVPMARGTWLGSSQGAKPELVTDFSMFVMTLETGELPLPTLNNSPGTDPVCSEPSTKSFLTAVALLLKVAIRRNIAN